MENRRIKNIIVDSLNLTELKGKKLFLKILQTVKKFLLLQELGENFQSFHFCSWSKQRSTHTPFFFSSNAPKNYQEYTFVMMMNCFCGMVDWRKAFNLISSRKHC